MSEEVWIGTVCFRYIWIWGEGGEIEGRREGGWTLGILLWIEVVKRGTGYVTGVMLVGFE